MQGCLLSRVDNLPQTTVTAKTGPKTVIFPLRPILFFQTSATPWRHSQYSAGPFPACRFSPGCKSVWYIPSDYAGLMCLTVPVMSLTAFGLQEADTKSTGFITLIKRTQMLTSHFLTPIYFCISAIPTSSQSCEANHSAYTCWELCYGRVAVSQAQSRRATQWKMRLRVAFNLRAVGTRDTELNRARTEVSCSLKPVRAHRQQLCLHSFNFKVPKNGNKHTDRN